MAEETKCACGSANVAIFPCVGASNVGKISNKITIELEKQNIGNLMCTVGIGAILNTKENYVIERAHEVNCSSLSYYFSLIASLVFPLFVY